MAIQHSNTIKWYMHNQESVLVKETHKILWDFEIQIDDQILARRPDLVIVNVKRLKKEKKKKRTCRIGDFVIPADHRVKLKESEKRNEYLDLARELKKLWHLKVTVIPIIIGALGTVTKGLIKGLEDLGIKGQVEIIQTTHCLIGQNTEKSPGDLRGFAIT